MIENIRARQMLQRDYSIGSHQSRISWRYPISRNWLVFEMLCDGNVNDTNDGTKTNWTKTNWTFVDSDVWYWKQCLSLDWSSAYVTIANNSNISGTGAHSMFSRVNITSLPSSGVDIWICAKWYDYPANWWWILLRINNVAWVTQFEALMTNWTNTYIARGITASTWAWYDIWAVFTGSTIQLWVNGIMIQETATTWVLRYGNGMIIWAFKSNAWSLWAYFNGKIQWVRLYNKAFYSLEINTIAKEWLKLLH